MNYVIIALKVIVGLSILHVWLGQPKKVTKWRGGNAENLIEEFEVYGLSKSFFYVVGFLKVSLALILLASIQFESLSPIGSIGLAVLLFGSIIMHYKVKDELYKSIPSLTFFVMNLIIIYAYL